jgi:hypothetical protein
MHKCQYQIIKVVQGAIVLMVLMPVLLLGQGHPSSSHILEVQHSFLRGEIDAETAALEQFRMLYEQPEYGNSIHSKHKCATPATMFLQNYSHQISEETRLQIQTLQATPSQMRKEQVDKSYISPSGKFEIVYDTTGSDSVSLVDEDGNGVPDYVDLVAESADSSYRHEVMRIGFKDPIPAGTTYRIELSNMSFYGETRTRSGLGPQTYIIMENDFENFPPNTHPEGDDIGAVYATVAHEFKHAIQYAQNEWRAPSGAINWAEMDATLMEEVVYDDVNDYYNYIKNDINSSDPFSASIFFAPENGTPGAYYHVSWMIYYTEFFGDDVLKDVWELIEEENDLSIDDALREVLPDRATDFPTTFIQNHLWHFASGSRSGRGEYGFDEKAQYPNANLDMSFNTVPIEKTEMGPIKPLAARYFEVTPGSADNGSIDVAVDFDSTQVGVGLLIYFKNGDMKEVTAKGEGKLQVYIPTDFQWENVEKVGVVVANYSNSVTTRNLFLLLGKNGNSITIRDPEYANLPKSIKIYQNYPNPFNPTTNIDFDLSRSSFVKIEVFDITGRKIQTLTERLYRLGSHSIPFDGQGLSSGIYLYRIQVDDAVITKKMTLLK